MGCLLVYAPLNSIMIAIASIMLSAATGLTTAPLCVKIVSRIAPTFAAAEVHVKNRIDVRAHLSRFIIMIIRKVAAG